MRRHVSHGDLYRRWSHDADHDADCVTNTDGYRVTDAERDSNRVANTDGNIFADAVTHSDLEPRRLVVQRERNSYCQQYLRHIV